MTHRCPWRGDWMAVNEPDRLHWENDDTLRNAGALAGDLLRPTVRLGVTGLSRAGKTVFITSMVHNLLHGGRLPFFDAMAQGRIERVFLEPQPDDDVPRFAYEDHLAAMTGPDRHWPKARGISASFA